MNIFRFVADMLHLAAILMLLYRIKVVRNCIGKYLKSFLGDFTAFCENFGSFLLSKAS